MKKVARLRMPPDDFCGGNITAAKLGSEQSVRTTGRIKKPKAVFDPSDNYLSRAQRAYIAHATTASLASSARETPISQPTDKRLSQSSATSSVTTNTSISNEDVCAICLKKEAKRGSTAKNKFVTCSECEKKVHKLCLKVDFEDFDATRHNYKCEECRSCEVCDAFAEVHVKNDKDLVTCAKCLKSYHLSCHIPNVLKYQQFQRNWKCNKCSLPTVGNGNILDAKDIREIIGDEPKSSTKQQSQQQQQNQNVNIASAAAEAKNAALKRSQQELKSEIKSATNTSTNGNIGSSAMPAGGEKKRAKREDANSTPAALETSSGISSAASTATIRYSPNEPIDLPDVKYWSVDQVTEFFAKYFPNEAYVFKEHEIDGMSLLLLKRSDVIKKLPIKLGPSLRIYSLILKIQSQVNDSTLGWNCGL